MAALDAGADDSKPFGFAELLARIRVALRHVRRISARDGSTDCGPLRLDLAGRRAFVSDKEIQLTTIEYRPLAAPADNAGRVVTHRRLPQVVWGPGHSDRLHYLRDYMAHLHGRLEPDPGRPRISRIGAGVGYRMRADQEE